MVKFLVIDFQSILSYLHPLNLLDPRPIIVAPWRDMIG